MTRRAIELLLLVALGAVLGWTQGSPGWTFAGALVGALIWSVIDGLRARSFLRWLNKADVTRQPRLSGTWGEMVDRARKLIKKLEKKAQSSDARLEDFLAAIQASPNGVVLLDSAGRIEWSNLTAANHLGFDPQRDLGQYVRNMVRNPAFTAYLAGGDFNQEIQIDGPGPRPSQPTKISVQIHPYGKKRKLLLSRDVTAVQLAETMRRDFVANVSHEIRTPLTVLSGFVETMQSIPLDEADRTRYLGLMSQQAHRMQTLVSDLLTLSRLEGSPAPGPGEWIDSEELLTHVVQEARGLTQAISATVHQIDPIPGPSLWVSGAKTELLSAMSNLLSNAVRYTPGGGLIQTGWRLRSDGWGEFFVKDTGPGIAAEHLPRLTERFYRVDRSRSRETGGTGLGLAIVKHVAQRHGGHIDAESIVGEGSRFAIALPPNRVRERVSG
ncbi:phosphate regulon sensor histidine kinase PhoR [Hydrogenophaga sp.]|uniref:phosphate regulon sensor histidine kinase PhoR n=1 Tax=Hydrogenophaga sp. TaxID=1904254 RepID=UPI00273059E6|nr:phosphate regulon sensor histidine kinase PhoR [Hydrogenophaga sp.]MDP2018864.1 phosphate regulon sensor histidine kinase PhoR [Hydrogenophaga sp.]MDP3167282.1 phosphate regulon sensor histidine kinase PhoR [Hydrogenophaga sp.]MDP3810132.1 phosphate regulon sensor histidine kinase PhoR [Hydrogenophaga sp.]